MLSGKTKQIYAYLFEELSQVLTLEFGSVVFVETILSDQEAAFVPAITSIQCFANVRFSTCYFHYNQNLVRYIRSIGLITILDDPNFEEWLGAISGKLLPKFYLSIQEPCFCLTTT
jgi:hypothetical protein